MWAQVFMWSIIIPVVGFIWHCHRMDNPPEDLRPPPANDDDPESRYYKVEPRRKK